MTDRLPTIERHMFRPYKNNPECTYVEPGPGRACREPKDHEVHTPNGCTRESWLQTKLDAAGLKSRGAAAAILTVVKHFPDSDEGRGAAVANVVEALHDLLDETEHWKRAWAHSQVDKDHQVRDAMARSESCEHHGAEIKQLSGQVQHFDEAYRRADAGRVSLLGVLFELDRFVDAYQVHVAAGRKVPDTDAVVAQLRTSVAAAHRAHERAWKR